MTTWLGPALVLWGWPGVRQGSLTASCFNSAVVDAGVGCGPGATLIVIVLLLSRNVTSEPFPDLAHPSG